MSVNVQFLPGFGHGGAQRLGRQPEALVEIGGEARYRLVPTVAGDAVNRMRRLEAARSAPCPSAARAAIRESRSFQPSGDGAGRSRW